MHTLLLSQYQNLLWDQNIFTFSVYFIVTAILEPVPHLFVYGKSLFFSIPPRPSISDFFFILESSLPMLFILLYFCLSFFSIVCYFGGIFIIPIGNSCSFLQLCLVILHTMEPSFVLLYLINNTFSFYVHSVFRIEFLRHDFLPWFLVNPCINDYHHHQL